MMADYGKPEFILSRNLNESVLVYRSRHMAGHSYVFEIKEKKPNGEPGDGRYRCQGCHDLGKNCDVTVRSGRFAVLKDPEEDHHENCRPLPDSKLEALILKRQMFQRARHGKRPRDAFEEIESSIPKCFKQDPNMHDAVASEFPEFNQVRRQLRRHFATNNVPVPNSSCIPEELRHTLYGKSIVGLDEGNRQDTYDRRWLVVFFF